MMQSGQDWLGYDGPMSSDGSPEWGVLAQSQVCAGLIVIERIQTQDPSQMPFTEGSRSGAQHTGSARATSVRLGGRESPSPGRDS
jgi:hypothetical protein